jgi:checkpoint serine/threonine-protein kinase
MTSASSSGINLVDLANLHKVKEGASVPEIIALYYTSRMIQHLETLHEEAQILHCDVKPDNWVLTTSEESSLSDVEANDVILCDFGKAVDLKGLGVDSNLSCHFTGSPVGKDMEPGSLRDGKPWFFDMDLFGLCASSHVLLFGTHMDITKVQSTKRWKLTKPIRRYWQRSLWQEYFDTLLNDCGEGVSSTQVLKKLRMKFEDYLSPSTRQEELGACLRRQESFLPKRKE